jgi:hypothetical protein
VSDVTGFAGLPDEVASALAAAPVTDKALLELLVGWVGLSPGQARMAEALRVFVVTWDPLEWLGPRPEAVATVNVDPLELVVYLPIWSITRSGGASVPEAVGAAAGSAVVVSAAREEAIRSGAYPVGVREGGFPQLLCAPEAGSARSTGDRQGWPSDGPRCGWCLLAGSRSVSAPSPTRGRLCTAHRAEADAVTAERLEAARASNLDGLGALGEACARLERPHLPNGLLGRLVGAEEGMSVQAEPDQMATWAGALIEAAGWFPGRAEDLAVALGAEPDMPWLAEWTLNIVLDLGRVGYGALAAEVGAALAGVDEDNAALYAADGGVALAESGLVAQSRDKIADNLAAWPDDVWVRVHAGDALVELGDFDAAGAHFAAAMEMADDADDFEAVSIADERLVELRKRRRQVQKTARRDNPTAPTKPGELCPRGSGSKFKHCHGRRRR